MKYQDQHKSFISNSVKGPKQLLHRPQDQFPIIPNNTNCVDTSIEIEKSLKNLSSQLHQGPMPVSAYLIASAQNQKVASSVPDEISSQVCALFYIFLFLSYLCEMFDVSFLKSSITKNFQYFFFFERFKSLYIKNLNRLIPGLQHHKMIST